MNIPNMLNNKPGLWLFLILLPLLVGCSVVPGTFEVGLQPEQDSLFETQVIEEIELVIKAILSGSISERVELVSYSTTACTLADGLGGPPKCAPGEAEGTLVQVLPVSAGEGSFSRPDSIDQALDFVVMGLYAVYRVPEDENQYDYWPAGEYGIVFTREMNQAPFPITVLVEEGRIVRINYHIGIDPQELINQLPVEDIILTPIEAQNWMDEHEPEPPAILGVDNGTVTGSVCFPSEYIPEMTLYFREVRSSDLAYQNLTENQASYSVILSPGSYIAFAYPVNSGGENIGGTYSQAVNCGLGVECTDHAPLVFEVKPGEKISGVDICDWYSPGDVPPEPLSDENTEGSKSTGMVVGKICYPSEFIPEMTLFFKEKSSQQITELSIAENQSSYNFALTPGQYVAYAYLNSGSSLGGSYSNAVLCGLGTSCSDHTLVEFNIKPGETFESIDICDWYSPETIPPDPRAVFAPLASMIYRTEEGDYF